MRRRVLVGATGRLGVGRDGFDSAVVGRDAHAGSGLHRRWLVRAGLISGSVGHIWHVCSRAGVGRVVCRRGAVDRCAESIVQVVIVEARGDRHGVHARQPRFQGRWADPAPVHLRWPERVTRPHVVRRARGHGGLRAHPRRSRRARLRPLAGLQHDRHGERRSAGGDLRDAGRAAAGHQRLRQTRLRRSVPTVGIASLSVHALRARHDARPAGGAPNEPPCAPRSRATSWTPRRSSRPTVEAERADARRTECSHRSGDEASWAR